MNPTLRLLPLAALLAVPFVSQAQNELSNFSATGRGGVINTFATDYQVIGINPANLGRKTDHKAAVTVGETGIGIASQSMSKTLFKKLIYNSNDPIDAAGRVSLVNSLTSDNTINANIDVTLFGAAVTLPNGLGGIAASYRVRGGSHIGLNRTAADIIVNGKNAAVYTSGAYANQSVGTSLDGTNIQGAITDEFNLAYGVQVLDISGLKLSAGVGYRYIQGVGIVDVRAQGGTLFAYEAISPVFNVDYGSLATNPNFSYKNGSGAERVGHGHGFDVGLAAEVGKMLRVGVSVVDIGSMTWDGNVLTAQNQQLQQTNSNGITSYNVFEELSNQFNNDNNSLFTYEPNKTHNGGLPTKLRTGAGIRISDLFEAGVDVTVPLNKVAGNLTSTFVGVGLDYKPLSWLRLSSGVTGGAGYGASLPLGVTLVTGSWEAGISSRDVVGLFNESSPYTSVALGLLRFKIGSEK